MKKNITKLIPVLLLFCVSLFSGCKEMKIKDANADFKAFSVDASGTDAESASPGGALNAQLIGGVAIVRVEFMGTGQNKSIWWGTDYNALDATQEVAPKNYFTSYDLYLAGNVAHDGAVFNKYGVAKFRYLVPGTYKIYVISTNWQEGSGAGLERDIKTVTVTITN